LVWIGRFIVLAFILFGIFDWLAIFVLSGLSFQTSFNAVSDTPQ
jgi:hypothetical protein